MASHLSFGIRHVLISTFALLAFLVRAGSTSAQTPSAGTVTVLKAARLFDGRAKALVSNGVVIIEADKIVDAGSGLAIPQGAQVIDLGDATLSPGFIDAHTHLTSDYSKPYLQRQLEELQTELPLSAYEAIPNAERTINAGLPPCATSAAQASWM